VENRTTRLTARTNPAAYLGKADEAEGTRLRAPVLRRDGVLDSRFAYVRCIETTLRQSTGVSANPVTPPRLHTMPDATVDLRQPIINRCRRSLRASRSRSFPLAISPEQIDSRSESFPCRDRGLIYASNRSLSSAETRCSEHPRMSQVEM